MNQMKTLSSRPNNGPTMDFCIKVMTWQFGTFFCRLSQRPNDQEPSTKKLWRCWPVVSSCWLLREWYFGGSDFNFMRSWFMQLVVGQLENHYQSSLDFAGQWMWMGNMMTRTGHYSLKTMLNIFEYWNFEGARLSINEGVSLMNG